jgi:pimeloyl-ACP methyl ester carboxylesterase
MHPSFTSSRFVLPRDWINYQHLLPITTLEDFHFVASDGVRLRGVRATPLVRSVGSLLFLRGGYGREQQLTMSVLFDSSSLFFQGARAQYTTYTIDYRGTGASEGVEDCNGIAQIRDTIELLDYIQSQETQKIIVGGHSRGADAAVLAANRWQGQLAQLILLSGRYDMTTMGGERPEMLAHIAGYIDTTAESLAARSILSQPLHRLIDTPVYIAHGKQDRRTPFSNAIRLKDYLDTESHTSVRCELFERGEHVMNKDWLSLASVG